VIFTFPKILVGRQSRE